MRTASQHPAVDRRFSVHPWQATLFLVVTHTAGLVGLLTPTSQTAFQWATPFHLLLTTGLLLYFHRDWRTSFWLFAGSVMLIGYWVEVAGVHTSLVFGEYAYDTTLGVKVLEVPLMIAVNWLLLTYVCGSVCYRIPGAVFFKVISAALLMVALDYLIEPVAIAQDFWHWASGDPPLHNYLGWWVVALLVQSLFFGLSFRRKNPLAAPILLIQVLFFSILQAW